MKKSIFLFAAGCVMAAFFPGLAVAQGPNAFIHLASRGDEGMISMRAMKDFSSRFENAEDARWFAVKGGFVANFKQDGFMDRAYYNKNGVWQYCLRFFDEKTLPVEIRGLVKRSYYDFHISFVEVVEIPEHLVYLVHLEDATTIKIVRVSDEGGMDVLQEFTKA